MQQPIVDEGDGMMSFDGPTSALQGDPPAETSWGFTGQVVRLVQTREQADATIRFFGFIRDVIVDSPRHETTAASVPLRVTLADSEQWVAGEFQGDEQARVIMRALKVIARDPEARADTLLSLEAHMAYLRGSFDLTETA
jgi:hypothetical protein